VDTSGATVQTDLLNPDSMGQPLGGGPPETTTCLGTPFGATVWFDFHPQIPGGVQIDANGFDTVVTVYEYNVANPAIKSVVKCSSTAGVGERLQLPRVQKGKYYTVQVGGAGAATGMLDFQFGFFGDTDDDRVLDEEPDKCPDVPGIREAGGCPPELRASPRVRSLTKPGGVRIVGVDVSSLPKGAKVEARCKRCKGSKRSQTAVARTSQLTLRKLTGLLVPTGAKLEILVTRSKTKSGRYRHGAIGNYFSYTAGASGLGKRVDRCLKVGKRTPSKQCT
jgi:hypothetical protein